VGAPSSKGGTSPIAVFYNNVVRKLTPEEAIRLQGFDEKLFAGLGYGDVLRMAGDAVSRPVGAFVVDSVFYESELGHVELEPFSVDAIPQHGYWHAEKIMAVKHNRIYQPRHIWEYLDPDCKGELSPQASAGLCCRIIRSQSIVPSALFEVLYEKSKTRTKLLGTKVDSFEILHTKLDAGGYLEKLRLQPESTQMDLLFDPD
jgi:hypothetical protein